MNYLKFTEDKLNVETLSQLASSPQCGAICSFVGTTRDNFDNKTVIKLEYEAYESMAIKALEKICNEIRQHWPDVRNIVIYHRLGIVPVQEASIVIAISSPHRKDAIQATEWCIDNVKKSVPIWKKEIYADNNAEWKENKESKSIKSKKLKSDIIPSVQINPVPHHLIQIKATNDEINKRIETFMERKRNEINEANIREFCPFNRDSEFTCARIDAILRKRHDSKSHLQVNRVLNSYYRDQTNSDYLKKHIPPNGIEERLHNLEVQLNLTVPTPKDIYGRLKKLEDRMLYLESISPEYINFWDKISITDKPVKKKIYSIEEIDAFIADLEQRK